MPHSISSSLTIFHKFISPVISILVVAFMLFQLLRIGFLKGDPSVMFFLPFFAFLLGVSLWPLIKLKRVSVDNDFLYVSNYFNETRISIRDIYNVTENRWINFHPVTIHLRSPSEFGRKIVFAPTFRMFGFFTPHPIVGELKEIARSKSLSGF